MANAGEMWIELGLKDNVNTEVHALLEEFKRLDNKIKDVVNSLHAAEAKLGEDEMGFSKRSIAQTREYYDLITKIAKAQGELNAVMGERNSRGLKTTEEQRYLDTLQKLRDQLKNGVPLGDKDFANAFKLSLGNTITELKQQIATAKGEIKKFDETEAKKMETRRAITAETERLAAAEERLHRLREDSQSKATIASIKEQNVEYDAQMQKVRELDALLKKVEKDRLAALRGSGTPHSSMTDAVITKEVDAIQRRYNEAVALGTKLEQDDANAKRQQKEETDQLNAKLRENQRIYDSVSKLTLDTINQKKIAEIRGMAAEYEALRHKMVALVELEIKIREERRGLENGTIHFPRTKEDYSRQLDAIQRQYNEDLARGKELERQDAEAKKQATDASRRLAEANKSLMSSYDKVTQSGRQTMSTLSMLRQQMGYYFSLFGMQTLLRDVITIGGQFEFQHVALQNIIGDAEKATAVFSQLKDLAVESPKTFMELTASAKQLSAYQIPANELFDTTKRLSDLSVGLGVDMNRLILAYGQVRSAAVLRGQELRQFTEAGIPLVQALAQKFTELNGKVTSTADVFKLISQRAVSFEMVKEVLWDMTNQGGQFFNMQSTMADTLYGKWQKLADIWQITLGDMANMNVGGFKPFHALIDTLVFAARNLSNLMPILTGMMTAKGFSFLRSNAINKFTSAGLDKNIAQAQKLQAIELRRAYVNGEISKKIYQQRMAMNANKDSYYMLLAAEGRISNYQIRRLIEEKKITAEKIRQGLANGTLIQQEAVQLRLLMQQNAQGKLGTIGGMAKGLGNSILSFMGGWTGVVLAGLGTAWSIYSNYKQKAEEEEAQAKERIKSAQELWKNADTTLKAAVNEGASESSVNNMSQWLKENSASWDMVSASMKNNDGTAKTLQERYDLLKDAIEGVKNASEQASDGMNIFSDSKNGGDIADSLKDAEESLGEFQKVLNDRVSLNYAQLKKAMDDVIAASPNFKKAIEMEGAENSLTRQMEIIQRFPKAWNQLWGEFSSEGRMLKPLSDIRMAWTEYEEQLQNARANIPDFAEEINRKMRNKWDDINFKNLTSEQREYLMKMYKAWLEENNITSSAVLRDLDNKFLNKYYNIRLIFTAEQGNELNSFQKDALGYLGKGATPFKSGAVQRWGQGGSAYAARNAAKSEIDSAYNEWQAQDKMIKSLKKQGKEVSEEAESLNRQLQANYNDLVSAAWASLGYEYEGNGLKSNKTPKTKGGGGTKTDVVAKAMRERVSVLKDAYSEYKKWTELLGKEGALAKVKESGIFGSLFADKDFKGLDDYKGELKRIKSKLSPEKAEQRKVIESIDKILLGMDYDEAKEKAEKDIALIQSAMEKLGKAWDNYKSLYEKTGNKAFAELAFSGGTLWDEKTKAMADELSKRANLGTIDFTMSEESAKEFFNYNTTKGKALYDLWKQIVDLIRGNYVSGLNDTAAAMAELMDEEDKILKIEQEIADLRAKGAADNDPRIIKKQREIEELQQKAFEKSGGYLKFYNAILSMTIPEAEKIGQEIREKLDKSLQRGTISAKEYVRQIKLIGEQMKKLRDKQSNFSSLINGGLQGLFQNKYDNAESDFNKYATDMEKAANDYKKAFAAGDKAGMESAESAQASAASMKEGAAAAMQGAQGAMGTVAMIDKIVHGINDVVQGIKGTFDEIREMYDALGSDTESDNWEGWNTFFSGFSKASQNATNAWDSLKNGNVGGVIQGVVGSFTSWVTEFSRGHDRKLDHQIKLAQEQINAIDRLTKITEMELNRTLGALYNYRPSESTKNQIKEWYNEVSATRKADELYRKASFGPRMDWFGEDTEKALLKAVNSGEYYDEQLALLLKKRDEIKEQLSAEEDKKDNDSEKIADYKQSIAEIGDQIEHFAEDMAKALYDIDIKSWAQELTDAVVDAWVAGEDAAQAWHDKVKDLVKDVTKNILAQKVVEMALQPVLDYITEEMTAKSGKLDESSIMRLSELLNVAGDTAVNGVTSLLDAMKEAGYDLSDTGKGSSSASQVLSGLSENDQSLLMSYINAIRGDVSIQRGLMEQLVGMMNGTFPNMNATVQLQLRELEAITVNTRRNADSAEFIETFCRGLRDGEYTIKVK